MRRLNRENINAQRQTNRVIQFGKGNFLRGFIDWIIGRMNSTLASDMGVTIIQSVRGSINNAIDDQDGLYHVITKGLRAEQAIEERELIDVVNGAIDPYNAPDSFYALADDLNNRFIISNTTEQGIEFRTTDRLEGVAESFPAKLTQLLYRRYITTEGDMTKGFIILPCELIEQNGVRLHACIERYIELWGLSEEFKQWVAEANHIANTLVDRIVSGYPKRGVLELEQSIGFEDRLMVEAEPYNILVIEGDDVVRREFCADQAGCNVLFVDDITPYRERKVTLLNAPHTLLSPIGCLCGMVTVQEAIEDNDLGRYTNWVMRQELQPTLSLPQSELTQFCDEVIDRFANPFLEHHMKSIMLNAFSKFKSRNIPAMKRYLAQRGSLPEGVILGFAAIICYYNSVEASELKDDPRTIAYLKELWQERTTDKIAEGVLSAEWLWGEDLTAIEALEERLCSRIIQITDQGMQRTLELFNSELGI